MWPYEMKQHPCPLASNSNFRIDLLYWKLNDFENAQKAKEEMENL